MKTCVIVQEGQWGLVEEKTYLSFIEYLKTNLERAQEKDSNDRQVPAIKVEVIETFQKTQERLKSRGVDTLIFISRGMIKKAKQVAGEFPKLRVVLLTALLPEGEVIFLNKWRALSTRMLQSIVLSH